MNLISFAKTISQVLLIGATIGSVSLTHVEKTELKDNVKSLITHNEGLITNIEELEIKHNEALDIQIANLEYLKKTHKSAVKDIVDSLNKTHEYKLKKIENDIKDLFPIHDTIDFKGNHYNPINRSLEFNFTNRQKSKVRFGDTIARYHSELLTDTAKINYK